MTAVDWTGQRFGLLVAIEPTDERRNNKVCWRFKCDCGSEVVRVPSEMKGYARKGMVPSCGCRNHQTGCIDITGQRFGMLVAIRRVAGREWLFLCDCGNEVIRDGSKARYRNSQGKAQSCGCFNPTTKPYGVAARQSWLNRYIRGAADRNIPWELTDEEAFSLFEQDCHYCGAEPTVGSTNRFNGAYPHNGIDRKDSSQGYSVENCVPCCSQCNFLKLSMPYEEFAAWLDRLVEFRLRNR
jgi:hypothetical protein